MIPVAIIGSGIAGLACAQRLAEAGMYLGGDWCIGTRVEAAWTSGTAIADNLLERSS